MTRVMPGTRVRCSFSMALRAFFSLREWITADEPAGRPASAASASDSSLESSSSSSTVGFLVSSSGSSSTRGSAILWLGELATSTLVSSPRSAHTTAQLLASPADQADAAKVGLPERDGPKKSRHATCSARRTLTSISEMPLNLEMRGLENSWQRRGGKEMFGSNFQVGLQRFGCASPDLAMIKTSLCGRVPLDCLDSVKSTTWNTPDGAAMTCCIFVNSLQREYQAMCGAKSWRVDRAETLPLTAFSQSIVFLTTRKPARLWARGLWHGQEPVGVLIGFWLNFAFSI